MKYFAHGAHKQDFTWCCLIVFLLFNICRIEILKPRALHDLEVAMQAAKSSQGGNISNASAAESIHRYGQDQRSLSAFIPEYVTYGPYGAWPGYSAQGDGDPILANGLYNVHYDYGLTLTFSWVQVVFSTFCLLLGRHVKDNILKLGGVTSPTELRSVLEFFKDSEHATHLPKKFLAPRQHTELPKDAALRQMFLSEEQKQKNPFMDIFPGT